MSTPAEMDPLRPIFESIPLEIFGRSYETDSLLRGEENSGGGLRLNPAYRADRYGDFNGSSTLEHIFKKQALDPDDLLARQRIQAEYARLERDIKVGGDFRVAMGFAGAHHYERERVYDPERSTRDYAVYTPRIEQHKRHAPRDEKGNYINDGYPVWVMPEKIADSKEASARFIAENIEKFPILSEAIGQRLRLLPDPHRFDPRNYIGSKGRPKSIRNHLDLLEASVDKDAWIGNLVTKLADLSLRPITATTGIGFDFKGLAHVKFDRKQQELNDITIGETPVVLTGRNGSGKTHLLESIGLATITSGSVGGASVDSARISPVNAVVAEYRPQGGGWGLSAFGTEAVRWGEILEWLDKGEKRKLVLSDEPFSTTDPHEQEVLIGRLLSELKRLGAQVVFTSHSDVHPLVNSGQVKAFQFVRDNDRKRLLIEGIGDSQSLDEARERNFSSEIIDRAEELLRGDDFTIDKVKYQKLVQPKSVLGYFGNENPGLGWFMKARRVVPARRAIGLNEDAYRDRSRLMRELGEKTELTQCNYVFGNVDFLDISAGQSYGKYNVLAKMLKEGSTINEEDIALRTEFFDSLKNYENLNELTQLLDTLKWTIFSLSAHCYRYESRDNRSEVSETGANPLIDLGLSIARIWTNASSGCSKDDYSSRSKNFSNERMLFMRQTALIIDEVFGDSMPEDSRKLFKDYVDIIDYLEAISNISFAKEYGTNWYGHREQKWPVDEEFREKVYDFCSRLGYLVDRKENEKQYDETDIPETYHQRKFKIELDRIFFEVEHDENYRQIRIKPLQKIGEQEMKDLRTKLLNGSSYDDVPRNLADLLRIEEHAPSADLSILNAKHHSYFVELQRIAESASGAGMAMPAMPTIMGLNYLTSDLDLIGGISDHFKKVGGTIGNSIAEYLVDDLAQFFDGARTGLEYKELAVEKVKRASVDAVTQLKKAERRKKNDIDRRDIYHYAYRLVDLVLPKMGVLGHTYADQDPVTIYSEVKLLESVIDIASMMSERKYTIPKRSGSVDFESLLSPSFNGNEVGTTAKYESLGGIDVISGSNMSGKTNFGKSMFLNIAFARSLGLVSSKGAKIPLYAKNVYIDRPKQDAGKGLSSFAADLENWKKALAELEDAAPSFVFIDEPFSSTSAKYQEVLLLSSLEWLAKRGHRVVVATHNHSAIARLRNAKEKGLTKTDITFHNLHSTETEDGLVDFTYQFSEGEAPSMALSVARMLGGKALQRLFA